MNSKQISLFYKPPQTNTLTVMITVFRLTEAEAEVVSKLSSGRKKGANRGENGRETRKSR